MKGGELAEGGCFGRMDLCAVCNSNILKAPHRSSRGMCCRSILHFAGHHVDRAVPAMIGQLHGLLTWMSPTACTQTADFRQPIYPRSIKAWSGELPARYTLSVCTWIESMTRENRVQPSPSPPLSLPLPRPPARFLFCGSGDVHVARGVYQRRRDDGRRLGLDEPPRFYPDGFGSFCP